MITTNKLGPDFRESLCPWCGHKIDTGQLGPAEPETGHDVPLENDLGVCVHCAGLLLYIDNQGTARKLTPKDMAELDPVTRERLIDTQQAVKALK